MAQGGAPSNGPAPAGNNPPANPPNPPESQEVVESSGMISRIQEWVGRRIGATMRLPGQAFRHAHEIGMAGANVAAGTLGWAGGNAYTAAQLGMESINAGWNTVKYTAGEAKRATWDTLAKTAGTISEKVSNLFSWKDMSWKNAWYKKPWQAAQVLASPVLGAGKGVKNFIAGGNEGDFPQAANDEFYHQNIIQRNFNRTRSMLGNWGSKAGVFLKHTFYTGPIEVFGGSVRHSARRATQAAGEAVADLVDSGVPQAAALYAAPGYAKLAAFAGPDSISDGIRSEISRMTPANDDEWRGRMAWRQAL